MIQYDAGQVRDFPFFCRVGKSVKDEMDTQRDFRLMHRQSVLGNSI